MQIFSRESIRFFLFGTLFLLSAVWQNGHAQIIGPSQVCPGSQTTYQITGDPCPLPYNWTVTPAIGSIVGSGNEEIVAILWSNAGTAQLCVEIDGSCPGGPVLCIVVTSTAIPPAQINASVCPGECVPCAGQLFCAPGTTPVVLQSWLGCDSVVICNISTIPNISTNLGTIELDCANPSITVCGEVFSSAGSYSRVCTGVFGCDSTVVFNLVLNADFPIADAGPNMVLNCNSTSVTLNGSNSSQGPEFAYTWATTGGNIASGNAGLTPVVNAPGIYLLTVTNTGNGCVSESEVVVTANLTAPSVAIGSTTLPCDGSPITLLATIFGGSGGTYSYTWTTTDGHFVGNPNIQNPQADAPGTYCLIVTDLANGCTSEACMEVTQGMGIEIIGPAVVCGPGGYTYLVETTSAYPPVTVYFQRNDEAPQMTTTAGSPWGGEVNEATVFTAWAVDASGCKSDTITLTVQIDTFSVAIEVEQNGCDPAKLSTSISGLFQNTATSWVWSEAASQLPEIYVTESGIYSVTVYDNFGCTQTDTAFVALDYSGICAKIEGHVWQDDLDNCASDPGELPLEGWLVQATNAVDTFFGTTDTAGHYAIFVAPGDYTLTVFPLNPLWEPCQNNLPVSVPNADDTATVDFLIKEPVACPVMTVDIGTAILRRCFTSHYAVNYCNEGTGTATDAYVVVALDPFLFFVNATAPNTPLGGNSYRFELGDVEPGECGGFSISVLVSCTASLGQTHCSTAHIFPDVPCTLPDPLWSGASLEIEADCSDSTRFTLKNVGTGGMTAPLEYLVIEDAVMYRYDVESPLGVGESIEISLPANGSTWRIEASQEPFHPEPSLPVAMVEGCGLNNSGSISTGFVNQFALGDPEPFEDIDCKANVGSYDPNDKQASPEGIDNEHFVNKNTDLEYLIRFQNTGTDTAFTVVIRDTLSGFLDITKVRPGPSSHPYQFEIYGPGILKFTFPDIMLPDSNVNEAASHGFVKFVVPQKEDLLPGKVIENSAAIYFDFNVPVLTNTTFHTIAKPVVHSLQKVVLCNGEIWQGVAFSSDTMLVETTEFPFYDSMHWTQLQVLPVFSEAISAQLCTGQSYGFDGQVLTTSGEYTATFEAQNGCDSTVVLTLVVGDEIVTNAAASICEGDSYLFDGQLLTVAGTYTATYATAGGCDSTANLVLSVLLPSATDVSAAICEGDIYEFNGQMLTVAGEYEAVLPSGNGCDSTIMLHLEVGEEYAISIDTSILEGDIYNGVVVHTDTVLLEQYIAANGCDSMVTVSVSVFVVGVENAVGEMLRLEVFPNPASDAFFVRFELKSALEIAVRSIDILGRQVVFEQPPTLLPIGEHLIKINAMDWPSGIYSLHFQTDSGTAVRKLIKG